MLGVTTGVNASFGNGDNNDAVAFHGGVGLNLMGGALTISAMTHIGPEWPKGVVADAAGVNANHDLRYLNDITTIWKITDALTSITDLNYIKDDGVDVQGYGVAQYLVYAISDSVSLVGRGEVWRDEDGFFVAQFANNNDFVDIQRGRTATLDPRTVGGGRTTYGALTLGLNLKPGPLQVLSGLLVRPEVRYDRSLNDTRPFDDSSDKDQLTFGVDAILSF